MSITASTLLTATKEYKFLTSFQAIFIGVLIVVNLIGAQKPAIFTLDLPSLGIHFVSPAFGACIVFFPLTYLIGDLLAEVYGYEVSRRVIWTGFMALLVANVMVQVILVMPHPAEWTKQNLYEQLFANGWRITFASIIAYTFGELCNSFVLAQLKVITAGKYLWVRTIGSTVLGEAVDTLIFYPLAFVGTNLFTFDLLLQMALFNYTIKVVWEILATPLTYLAVGGLKKYEGIDHYDEPVVPSFLRRLGALSRSC